MRCSTRRSGLTNPEAPVEEVRDGSIEFRHVDFAYQAEEGGEPVLKDISLSDLQQERPLASLAAPEVPRPVW